jgi:hypothetical protein
MRCYLVGVLFCWSLFLGGQVNFTLTTAPAHGSLTCHHKTVTVTATAGIVSAINYTFYAPGGLSQATTALNCTVAGVYTVIGQSASGSLSKTIAVTSNTVAPQLSLTPIVSSITCSQPNTVLSAFSTNSTCVYNWLGPTVGLPSTNSTYTAATVGVYTVIATDATNGCEAKAMATVIDQRDYPQLQLASIYTMECSGAELQLSLPQNATVSYSLLASAGMSHTLNAQGIMLHQPGQYTLVAQNVASGCTAYYPFAVWNCVGIEEAMVFRVSVQPNPTSGCIRFTAPVKGPVTISTVDGRSWIAIADEENGIDISDLPEGIYFIEFVCHQQKFRKRVVLVR